MLEKKIIYFLVALSKLSSNNLKKILLKKIFFFFLVGSGQWVSQCPGTTLQKKKIYLYFLVALNKLSLILVFRKKYVSRSNNNRKKH